MSEDYQRYVGTDHRIVKIKTSECIMCFKTGFVEMPRPDYIRYRNEMAKEKRLNIQEILPDMKRHHREQLINGTHPICSQELYGQNNCDHNFVYETDDSEIRCCEKCELWEDDQLEDS